jgi:hypothetical protein
MLVVRIKLGFVGVFRYAVEVFGHVAKQVGGKALLLGR